MPIKERNSYQWIEKKQPVYYTQISTALKFGSKTIV